MYTAVIRRLSSVVVGALVMGCAGATPQTSSPSSDLPASPDPTARPAATARNTPEPTLTDPPAPSSAVRDVPGEAFYEVGEGSLNGQPGDVLRTQALTGPTGTAAWAVLYLSTGVDGGPAAVSGTVIAPEGETGGPRPVLSWAHYSVGLSDECAPSREGTRGVMELAQPFVDAGFVFAATDYEGLGTPGLNPYYVGASAGSNVLDIARAARLLDGAGAGDQVGLLGESQGSHAVLWAGELAPAYAPELDILGVVASSTVADVGALMSSVREPDSSEISWIAALQIVWVWHHLLELPMEDALTDEALAIAEGFDEECPGFSVFPEEQPLLLDLATVAGWPEHLAANTPGHARATAPILMEHGGADLIEEPQGTFERLCAVGNTVEFVTLPGAGHLEPLHRPGRPAEIAEWLAARMAGQPATDDCAPGAEFRSGA